MQDPKKYWKEKVVNIKRNLKKNPGIVFYTYVF